MGQDNTSKNGAPELSGAFSITNPVSGITMHFGRGASEGQYFDDRDLMDPYDALLLDCGGSN